MFHVVETLVAALLGGTLGGYLGAKYRVWQDRKRSEQLVRDMERGHEGPERSPE